MGFTRSLFIYFDKFDSYLLLISNEALTTQWQFFLIKVVT